MTDVPQGINIRIARHADIGLLAEFNAAMALETEHKILDASTVRAGVAAVLADSHRGFYLVAEVAEKVIGCLMITHEWSDWRNGNWWWLQSVYVREECRREGVFRLLYADLEQRARSTPDVIGLRLYVERDNAAAIRTYAALGMREEGYRLYAKGFAERPISDRR